MNRFYDVEITTFASGLHTSRAVVHTAGEAWAAAREAEALNACVLLVGCQTRDVSYGDFHVWLAGDRAFLRLDEHREWYARGSALDQSNAESPVEFRTLDGTYFSVPRADTVTRSQAFEALDSWLQTGEMPPSLHWA
ncbi:Imm1 family immunity protein [Longimicrobium terrae]|uniref:Immunity protein Imm1 n=1 Tax=Longimicrobium terrae TaxID=1639882 RepID=A0A841GRD8_9BACT|nr:Imm1 family immunity protein [Longimicrobium terrae]MBB4634291.1 hypothetical protein [Longimicrobium terrae]MBB6068819.1 hypothetical protein [Longimicrobium terrae]NNC28003.1 hypothetical protein [Longimicrobium terrae]